MLDLGFYNMDCIKGMQFMSDNSVDLTLTDIPYDGVNDTDNIPRGHDLRVISKGKADVITFDLRQFLDEIYRVTKGTIIVFCGLGQFSEIFKYFFDKQQKGAGTPRQLVWHKTNPSPMNGELNYLCATENALYFRKRKAPFNGFCEHNVLNFPTGSSDMHPTEKNHDLIRKLIADNSNVGDTVFDPCAGSGSTLISAYDMGRKVLGFELDEEYYAKARERYDRVTSQINIYNYLGYNPYQE